MGDTYIGPFGRILPVPEKQSESPPPSRTDPRMIASQVRLPLPTKLNFGSDPKPGFTDPQRYDSSRWRQSGSPTSSSSKHEKLPSVNQLLTPASPLSPAELSRRPKREPLSPTEAAARHLYGWSKGALEELPHPSTQSSYFPPQSAAITQQPQPHYPVTAAVQLSSSVIHHAPYSPPGSRPPFPAPIDSHSYPQAPYAPPIPSGRIDAISNPSDASIGASKPAAKLIGEQVFPGEGACFVYDDGTHVKKVIDGEVVNGQWGVTKAGKPRKRLAIACLTCREKKIKCDPSEPKCVQCEKSGRECRFSSA